MSQFRRRYLDIYSWASICTPIASPDHAMTNPHAKASYYSLRLSPLKEYNSRIQELSVNATTQPFGPRNVLHGRTQILVVTIYVSQLIFISKRLFV